VIEARLVIVLHCHLPYVRHPEHEEFFEEDWFFEAVAETYVPLLLMMEDLAQEGVPLCLTLSVSPTLCEMMANDLLTERCARYLNRHVELARSEMDRRSGTEMEDAARFYHQHYSEVREAYLNRYDRDLLGAFCRLRERGHVELMGSAATHAILPLLKRRRCQRAQVRIGLETYARRLGDQPRGFWLPECAFSPQLDELLAEQSIRYTFVDTHGLLLGSPRPPLGVFAPARAPSGVAFFGRDVESSQQVWSADHGYPGDARYRDFYRDLGWHGDYDYLRPYLGESGERKFLGFKYFRITGDDVPGEHKQPYRPAEAMAAAEEHARHFVRSRADQAGRVAEATGLERPVIVSPYDAELFGHWWLEGVHFLEQVLRGLAHTPEVGTICACECLEGGPVQETSPVESTWGYKGYYEVWVNGSNDWVYPELNRMEARLGRVAPQETGPLVDRALNQCARHLLLAQSSDWPFLLCTKTADEYAARRFRDQVRRFHALMDQVEEGAVQEPVLRRLEWLDDPFPELDYHAFLPGAGGSPPD
jgi:1,4-alpha-glucan branching enzyme